MPRQRISLADVTTKAIDLIDREGFDALTLSNVARDLSVGPSALYTHIEGLDGLRYLVAVTATANLTHKVRNAAIGEAGERALHAMGTAYRGFAQHHPGQFASTLLPPRNDQDDLTVANDELLGVFALVYGAMGFDPDRSALAARSTRSAIHGFLALEHNSSTATRWDAEYEHLLLALQGGMAPASDRT